MSTIVLLDMSSSKLCFILILIKITFMSQMITGTICLGTIYQNIIKLASNMINQHQEMMFLLYIFIAAEYKNLLLTNWTIQHWTLYFCVLWSTLLCCHANEIVKFCCGPCKIWWFWKFTKQVWNYMIIIKLITARGVFKIKNQISNMPINILIKDKGWSMKILQVNCSSCPHMIPKQCNMHSIERKTLYCIENFSCIARIKYSKRFLQCNGLMFLFFVGNVKC